MKYLDKKNNTYSIYVRKRDTKTLVDFDLNKIKNAITKANAATEPNLSDIIPDDRLLPAIIDNICVEINNLIVKSIEFKRYPKKIVPKNIFKVELRNYDDQSYYDAIINIETIQDLVIYTLITHGWINVAYRYIAYRSERTRIREKKDDFLEEIQAKLKANGFDIETSNKDETEGNLRQANSNIDDESFGGRVGSATSTMMRKLALDSMTKQSRDNHINNRIYIHDLDSYYIGEFNCLSIPKDDLLQEGFDVFKNTDIRPARSICTAFQLEVVLSQLQSLNQFGGVASTHIDTTMAPFLKISYNKHYNEVKHILGYHTFKKTNDETQTINSRYYKGFGFNPVKRYICKCATELTIKELNQSIEGMYHNYNSLLSRAGNQLPFTSINYGADTSVEGQMIIDSLLRGSLKGVGKVHRTSIFPCGIFQYSDKINGKPGTPNYKLFKKAISSTVRRFYPNYFNMNWSVQTKGIEQDRNIKQKVISKLSCDERHKLVKIFLNNLDWLPKLNLELDFHKDPKKGLASKIITIHNAEEMKKYKKLIPSIDDIFVMADMNIDHQSPTELGATMGCRTYNGFDINFTEDYFKELLEVIIETGKLPKNYLYSAMQKDGRGNVAPNTIILPTIAMEAKELAAKNGKPLEEVFFSHLAETIDEAKDELLERFEWICKQSPNCAKFTYYNNLYKGFKSEEGVRSALKHGTLAIGQIALAETLQILVGCDHTEPKGMELAHKIEGLFAKKCAEYKNTYKLNFGVYYSPAESLCYTSYKKFVKKYGLIENVTAYKNEKGELIERGYFTNSIHIPVWKKIDPFKKFDIESELTGYSSAGCITYVEIENAKLNEKAVEEIIDYAMNKKDIPYLAINISVDQCLDCGYSDEDSVFVDDCCPICKSKNIQKPRRVTGYLSYDVRKTVNHGKQNEEKDRKKHISFKNLVNKFFGNPVSTDIKKHD